MCKNNDIIPFISVIIPIKNEEKYIKKFLQNLIEQTFSKDKCEFIFCDGNSCDKTLDILKEFKSNNSINIKLLSNEKENAPSGVNLGIRNAKGEIIIRLDAHTFYPKEYIEKNVYYLLNSDADNVGCPIDTIGEGLIGKIIAYIYSSKFGVGNSKFRVSNYNGFVDTVPFGCFRKKIIDEVGFFDENLPRSEDNDFNYRIRKNGGKVLMFNEIKTEYHSRSNISSLCKMGYGNGKGIVDLLKKNKESIGFRHLVPFIFVLGNLLGFIFICLKLPILKEMYLIIIGIYFLLDLFFSFKGIPKFNLIECLICFMLFPLLHICYGMGSLISFIKRR